MKILFILCALIVFSFQISLMAGHTSKHSEWRNGILILTYNGETRMFPSWTQEANDFFQNGPKPPQTSSNTQMDALIDAINNHRSVLNSHAKIINSQTDSIDSLIAENKRMRAESARLQTLAFTRVWTDIDGNSFTGIFIEYNLGAVKVQKVLDKTTYTILAGKLTPACKEMALALNKFK